MTVSIITVTLNRSQTLENTIQSVMSQTYQDIEYILVDGGSNDGTRELIEAFEPLFKGRLKWISEKDNGIYDAMNKGIQLSTGQIIGFLNSDDFFSSNTIIQQVVDQFTKLNIDAIYGDVHYVLKDDVSKSVRYYSSRIFRPWLMRFGFMPAHPSFYCRRAIFQKYGLFDATYSISADFELLVRFIRIHHIRTYYL